jgi:hypothetical protein
MISYFMSDPIIVDLYNCFTSGDSFTDLRIKKIPALPPLKPMRNPVVYPCKTFIDYNTKKPTRRFFCDECEKWFSQCYYTYHIKSKLHSRMKVIKMGGN